MQPFFDFITSARPYILMVLIGTIHSALIFVVTQAISRSNPDSKLIAIVPWTLGVPVAVVAFVPFAELVFRTELDWPWTAQLGVGLVVGLAASGGARDMHAAWKYVIKVTASKLRSQFGD